MARALGVHRQTVHRWAKRVEREGRAALKKAGRAGRKPRLGAAELRRIEQELKRGPEALGYETSLWTAPRVAELIRAGVRHPVPPRTRLEDLAADGLELSASGGTGAGTERTGHPPLEEAALAGA